MREEILDLIYDHGGALPLNLTPLVILFISFSISAYISNILFGNNAYRLPLHFFHDEDRESCITVQNLVVQLKRFRP